MRNAWLFIVALVAAQSAWAGGRKPPLSGILWDSTVMYDLGSGKEQVIAKPTPPWRYHGSEMNPDGKRLLFRAIMWDENGGQLATDLRTLDMETGKERVWYRGPSISVFGWSPDGRFIITEGMAPGYVAVIFDTQTEEAWLAKVPEGLAGLAHPAWSRDGKSLYVARPNGSKPGQGFTIMKMDLNGGNLKELVSLDADGDTSLSPDEKTVAYSPAFERDLYFVDIATGKIRGTKLTPPAEMVQGWSPDGKWVVVRQDTRATMDPTKYYAVNADTGEWRFLFKEHGGVLSWWQAPTTPMPDCGKIVREQLGPGRPLQEVAKKLFMEPK
jgi:tricorn protease-like protein